MLPPLRIILPAFLRFNFHCNPSNHYRKGPEIDKHVDSQPFHFVFPNRILRNLCLQIYYYLSTINQSPDLLLAILVPGVGHTVEYVQLPLHREIRPQPQRPPDESELEVSAHPNHARSVRLNDSSHPH
jgi:hypothetical protein